MGKKDLWGNSQKTGKAKKHMPASARATAVCIAAAAVICIAAGIVVYLVKRPDYAEYLIAQAKYPKTVSHPGNMEPKSELEWDRYHAQWEKYDEQRRTRLEQSEEYRDTLVPFYEKTIQMLLGDGEGENRVYSPLNLYMALSMLVEVTDGNSRDQLLKLLGAQEIDAVRKSAAALWNANYAADNLVTSRLANSVWLSSAVLYEKKTMERLADIYHASAFRGDMESEGFARALKEWLNEQTGGLLTEQAENVKLKPDTIFALISTIEFRAQWVDKWSERNTQEGVFHAAAGDLTCDFMNEKHSQTYYWGENFSAVYRSLAYSGGMWFFLPDEGVSAREVAGNEGFFRLLRAAGEWEDQTYINVNLSVPKFDIASDFGLEKELKALGVTDVFDDSVSDFSPMTSLSGIYVSEARHAARVKIDEEGCAAAAFTSLQMAGAGMPPEDEVDFILDRPFLFAITGEDGSILFVGVVEKP